MEGPQSDLFAQDIEERNRLSDERRSAIRTRLETVLGDLRAATTFPWKDPLDAVHEENRFQRETELLGDEGISVWEAFDQEMERLYATQSSSDIAA